MDKDEALKLALSALFSYEDDYVDDGEGGITSSFCYDKDAVNKAITAIRQALAQPVQEMTVVDPADWVPCTPEWINQGGDCAKSPRVWNAKECNHYHPATPPAAQRQWVDMPELELLGAYEEEQRGRFGDHVRGLLNVQSKLKEKNT